MKKLCPKCVTEYEVFGSEERRAARIRASMPSCSDRKPLTQALDALEECVQMLWRIEWVMMRDVPVCAECGNTQRDGHRKSCVLSAILRRMG